MGELVSVVGGAAEQEDPGPDTYRQREVAHRRVVVTEEEHRAFPERCVPETSTISGIGTTMPFALSCGSATCAWM
ncbi:hypothetical protein ACIPUC_00500 [Streptomyces sp. LARHCF249]